MSKGIRNGFLSLILLLFFLTGSLAHANQCSDIYSRWYEAKKHYGLQIFKRNLDRLQEILEQTKKMSASKKIEFFMSSDIRIVFFRLQSLARAYELLYQSQPLFTEKRAFFKKFEDDLGKIDLYISLAKISDQLNYKKLTSYFNAKKNAAIDKFLEDLSTESLDENTGIKLKSIYKELSEFEKWDKPKKDLKLQVVGLISWAEKLHKDIVARKFTQEDIEKGLHELRRRVRWLLIHIQAFNHLATFNEEKQVHAEMMTHLKDLLAKNPKLFESPFMKLASPDIQNPILIPHTGYAMLTETVTSIGVLKDKAEYDIFFADAMSHLNFSTQLKEKIQQELLTITGRSKKIDHMALSEEYQTQLENSKVLLHFAKSLRKLNWD